MQILGQNNRLQKYVRSANLRVKDLLTASDYYSVNDSQRVPDL